MIEITLRKAGEIPILTVLTVMLVLGTVSPLRAQSNAPVIIQQPTNQTVSAGNMAIFTVEALGGPFNYQWYHNTVPLTDLVTNGAVVNGAKTGTLSLTATLSSEGAYWVTLSNPLGWATSAVAVLTVTTNSSPSIQIEPPGAMVAGKSIADWSTNWWRWALALAPPGDPFTDTSGHYANVNQSGPVFLLAGSNGGTMTRRFHVPVDTYILMPFLVGVSSQLQVGFDKTETQIRQAVQQLTDPIDSLHASFDGVSISQTDLFTHREISPDFSFVAVSGNQMGVPPGNSGIAVANGYFLMLAPLPPGLHTLKYGAGATAYGLYIDETDTISVMPPIPLNFQRLNNALVLTWTNANFWLQSAPTVNGPYTIVTMDPFTNGPATSPYTNTLSGPQKFFRLWAY